MAQTNTAKSLPVGSFAASVVYSKALMARMIQRQTFKNKLSGKMPLDQWMQGVKRSESGHGYPIVQIADLTQTAGDQVTCDILNRIGGKPVMGDRIAKNSGEPIEVLRDNVYINQSRKVIDAGGRMSQQRSPHQYRSIARELAVDYFKDLEDNMVQTHLAGARGYAQGIEWKVPLESDPDFTEIAINDVLPPTRSRYVGLTASVTSVSNLATTNVLTLNFFDDLRTINDTSPVPLQGVKIEDANGDVVEGEDSPLLLSFISSEQWNQLQKQTSDQNWRTALADATTRLSHLKHPLFRNGGCILWRDIVICQAPRPIEFPQGSNVREYDTDGNIQTVQANVRAHRGVLLGAQAAAWAYGNAKRWDGDDKGTRGSGKTQQGVPFSWVEKLEDGDNLLQLFTGTMCGMKKLRYEFDGELYDNGVFTFDSYVPELRG